MKSNQNHPFHREGFFALVKTTPVRQILEWILALAHAVGEAHANRVLCSWTEPGACECPACDCSGRGWDDFGNRLCRLPKHQAERLRALFNCNYCDRPVQMAREMLAILDETEVPGSAGAV